MLIKLNIVSFIVCILFISSCRKDDVDKGAQNPQEISTALVVPYGNRTTGDLPPSTNQAFVIESPADSIYIPFANSNEVPVTVKTGKIKGFNVKVKGSSDYFHVEGGSITSFELIPQDMIKPGKFTISYNAFDVQGNISNTVERNVVIMDVPGGDSQFLTEKDWHETRQVGVTVSTGKRDSLVVSVPKQFIYSTSITCSGKTSKTTIQVVQETGIDYSIYTFKKDGSLLIKASYYSKTLNDALSQQSCSAQYNTTHTVTNYEGLWTYYHPKKRLLLVYDMVATDTQGNKVLSTGGEFEGQVQYVAGKMTWKSADGKMEFYF